MVKRNAQGRPGASHRNKQRAAVAKGQPPCHLCGKPIDYTLSAGHPFAFTIDHLVALDRGGSDSLDNLAAAHARCNFAKGNRTMEQWWQHTAEQDAIQQALAAVRPASGDTDDVMPVRQPREPVRVTRRVWGTPEQQAAMREFQERPGVGLL